MKTNPSPLPDRFLRLEEVILLVGVRKTTLYDLIKSDEFPAPVKIRACSVWSELEVRHWMGRVADSHRTNAADCNSRIENK